MVSVEEIRFYNSRAPYGFLSNLYPAPLVIYPKENHGYLTGLSREFKTSEHAYQYHKPIDKDVAEWIASAPDGKCAALAGHGLFPKQVKPHWSDIKVDVMKYVVLCKFEQHPELREQLVKTRDAVLIEASPTDSFWGEGPDSNGLNMLGKILMERREEIERAARRGK